MAKQKSVDLVQKVVDDVRETQAQYGYGNLGDAFTRWCVERLEGLESSEADEACEVQGAGDKSLDFYARNDKAALFTLGQCKFSESGNYQVSREEIADFFGLPARLQFPPPTAKVAFKEAAQSYQDAIAKGYEVELKFCVFGSLSPDAEQEVKHQKSKLPQKHGFIPLNLQDILVLIELEPVPARVLTIADNQVFTRNTDALAGSVKAKDLVQIYKDLGNKLFALNPRLYQGKGKAVNKELLTTLDPQKEPDGRKLFWYYNNGITAICRNFKLGHPQENKVMVEDLRVVNGCQTIRSLYEKNRESPIGDEVDIMFCLVKTEWGDFSGKISRRRNRQTAIKARDLISDDDEQRRIQDEVQKQYPSYFYERKQGEWREVPTGQKKLYKAAITSVEAGRAFLAFFLEDPRQMVIKSEEELCDVDGETYANVFKKSPAIKLLVPALLKRSLDRLRSQYAQGTQPTDKEVYALLKKDIAKAFAIGIIGKLFREKHTREQDLIGALKRLVNQWETAPDLPADLCKMAVTGLLSALGHQLKYIEKKLPTDKTMEDFAGLLPYLREPGRFGVLFDLRRSFILAVSGGVDPIAQLLP
jgi:hypothetical protein